MPIIRLKIGQNIEKVAKSNARLAQIPIIKVIIWGSFVFNKPLNAAYKTDLIRTLSLTHKKFIIYHDYEWTT